MRERPAPDTSWSDTSDPEPATLIGPVEVGPIAHGGHCVARYDDGSGSRRVIFVRHALPGESVMIKITDTTPKRFWRGDAVEVITSSADRVRPTCPVAGPGGCGGCDFQHVDLVAQRRLKAAVVAEQLHRLAGIDIDVVVAEVPHPEVVNGRGWRTRVHWVADDQGRPGLRAHRSHQVVVPTTGCEIASERLPDAGDQWSPGQDLWTVGGPDSQAVLAGDQLVRGTAEITEHALGRSWTVDAAGFWQVHPAAADTLAAAVLDGLRPEPGEQAFDLYCGVGLFAGALAQRGVQVWGVESYPAAVRRAEQNLAADDVRFTVGRVERVLGRLPRRTDLIVLDPPRAGAGRAVIEQIIRRRPRAIAYVACDPAALARDLGSAQELGYTLASLRAYDLFPQTHHVECVALLSPA